MPGHWTHVLDALRRAEAPGVRLAPPDRWQLATRDLADLPAAGPLPEGVELHWRPANGAPETTLLASEAGRAVAECQVWEVPPHLADAADWCCVEWLGVDETQRRRGLGAHLVRAQLARQAQQGKRHAALWTQVDNAPVRRLNERLGFRLGPECWQLHYQLDPV